MTEIRVEIVSKNGLSAPCRFRDPVTERLAQLSSYWESQHKLYMASLLSAQHLHDVALKPFADDLTASHKQIRDAVGKFAVKVLRQHPLYPWMRSHKFFPAGIHTVRLIAAIGDPLRFPGRMCADNHYLPEDYAGDTCSVIVHANPPKVCGLPVGPIRQGSGVRPLWHFCGLHTVNGKAPHFERGTKCSWNCDVRSLLLGGYKSNKSISSQLVMQGKGVQPWRSIYDKAKSRLLGERITGEIGREVDIRRSDSLSVNLELECGLETSSVIENAPEPALRLVNIDRIARKITVKAMIGDLLIEWKRLAREAA